MKKILLLSYLLILGINVSSAQSNQSIAQGINYQAVARNAEGQLLANQTITLKIALSSKNGAQKEHYAEIHEVRTDALGLFHIVIGRGKEIQGVLQEVPWSKEQIWIDIKLDPQGKRNFTLVNSAELMSVPYAFYAATASQLVETATEINLPQEKNQSIYWTTSGNTNTRPPTHFLGTRDAKDLVFKTNNVTRMIITADGLIRTFSVCADNGDQDPESYSIVAEGCKQGVYIKIDGSRSGDNNFLTFADDEDIWGRVEGQTTGELATSFDYVFTNTIFTINTIALALDAASLFTEAAVVAAQIVTIAEAAPIALQAAAITAEGIALAAELIAYNIEKNLNVGVTYESGSGDYAEWLEKVPRERDLKPGEIVGVKGGKISLSTQNADHYMVVSNKPIVLGNMPTQGQESKFEKVAFMGQVPVRIIGRVNIGDYILPSGNDDGFAIAVAPSTMKIGDYKRIIGVAWESAEAKPLNIVNVAVGINNQDLSGKMEALQQELERTNQKVAQIMAYLEGKAPSPNLATQDSANPPSVVANKMPNSKFEKLFSDAEFDQMLDQNAPQIKQYYALLEKSLLEKGYDLSKQPFLSNYFHNPIETIKQIRRDPAYVSHWHYADQKIKSKK